MADSNTPMLGNGGDFMDVDGNPGLIPIPLPPTVQPARPIQLPVIPPASVPNENNDIRELLRQLNNNINNIGVNVNNMSGRIGAVETSLGASNNRNTTSQNNLYYAQTNNNIFSENNFSSNQVNANNATIVDDVSSISSMPSSGLGLQNGLQNQEGLGFPVGGARFNGNNCGLGGLGFGGGFG